MTLFDKLSCVAVCAAMAGIPPAHADDYPSRTIQLVNPYDAGGTTDTLARGLAIGMTSRLGQQIVVVNKPGAGGTIGTAYVARAPADGYTILFAPALVISVLPQARPLSEVGYDPTTLTPVCQTFSNVMGLVVRNDSPFKTLSELVAAAKAKPGALTYGHQGVSTIPQLAIEEFLDVAKAKIDAVPYRSDPAIITDLIGGRVDVAAVVLGVVNSIGPNIRILGVFADQRHPTFPQIPTAIEQGFDVAPVSFGGLFVRKGTSEEVVRKLSAACDEAANSSAYRMSAQQAAQPTNYFADQTLFQSRLNKDVDAKRNLLKKLGQGETQ